MSAHQLHRTLGVTYKTAWFMAHRIRKAMETQHRDPIGGGGKVVEADETFWGTKPDTKKARGGWAHKNAIFSLVERGGQVRSFHIPAVTGATLKPILESQMSADTNLMTDDARHYKQMGKVSATHETVAHTKKEYVRGNIHTNTIEGFFGLLKRGLIGTYHHVGSHHLQRYVSEFDFRYNNRTALGVTDAERTDTALKGIVGKRLTYRRINAQ